MARLSSAKGQATTGSFDSTGATLLVAYVVSDSVPTFSDSKGNTWVQLTSVLNAISGARSTLYYSTGANLTSVGTGHTVTSSISYSYAFVEAHDGSWTFEDEDTADSGGSSVTTVDAGTLTPTTNGSLIVAGCVYRDGSSGITADSPLSVSQSQAALDGSYYGGALASGIQTTAASITPNFDWTTAKTGITGVMAVFAPSGGGGGGSSNGAAAYYYAQQ